MPDDQQRQVATDPDLPRRDATSTDQYSLTIEDALVRYEHAGHPRTVRSIQRYCANGHLDCLRQETTFGDRFMITPQSVARHIAQIDELAQATHRDMSRPDAAAVAPQNEVPAVEVAAPTADDMPRPVATGRAETAGVDPRYVEQIERENVFLREQIGVKDAQISELGTRARETNVLIKGLQELVLALNPGRRSPELGTNHANTDGE